MVFQHRSAAKVFVGTNMLCLLCAVSLPETKDKSLEEITQMLGHWYFGIQFLCAKHLREDECGWLLLL